MSNNTDIFDDCFDVIRDFSYEYGMFTSRDDSTSKGYGPMKTFIWGSPLQKRIIINGSSWNGTFNIEIKACLYQNGLRSVKSDLLFEELSAEKLKRDLRWYLDRALKTVNSWTVSELTPSNTKGL